MTTTNLAILLVEDNSGDARLLQRIFAADRHARAELICVNRLAQGLEQLSARSFDAVLLDLSLPDSIGLDTLKRVRAHAPNIPIVVFTGLDDEEGALEAMRLGAQDYLVKGRVEPEVLSRTMRYAIERKRAEEALRQAEENYRSIFENAVEGIYQGSPQGRFTSVNSAMARILGYASPDEVVTSIMSIRDQFYADPDRRTTVMQQLEQKGTLENYESECLRQDGSRIWISENARAVRDANGTLLYYEGFIQDITERKLAEEALRESEERLRALIEHSHDAITLLAADGTVLYDSPSIVRVLGYNPTERIGRSVFEFVHPEERQSMTHGFARFIQQSGAVAPSEARFLHKDGTPRQIEGVRTNLLHEPAVRAVVINYRDITERKRAEEEIRQRNQELATLNQIGQSLNKLVTPAEICETIFTMVGYLLDNRNLFIARYDEASQQISFPVYTIHGERRNIAGRVFGNGLTEYVIRTNAPLLVKRDLPGVMAERGIDLLGTPARSFLAVPLRAGEKIIGVIALQDYEKDDVYNEHHLELLTTIAAQAASALENARLFEATTEYAQRQKALYDISTALARVHDTRELCAVIASAMREILQYPFAGIFLIEPATGDRVLQAQSGWADVPENWRHPPGQGLSENALFTGTLQYTPDVTREPKYVVGRADTRSEVDVPIKIEDTALGVLVVEDPRVDAFTTSDFATLQAVANQLAVALERARLFEEQQTSLAMTTRLYELSTQVIAATTVEETARLVAETVRAGFSADACTFHLFDKQGAIEFRLSIGLSPTFHQEARARPTGLTARLRQTKEPIIATEEELNPRVRAEGIRTNIALPLPGEKENLGALFIGYRQPRQFSKREINLMSLFANHAALALRRARLFHQAQQRLSELEAVSKISTALRSATTLDEMLPRFLDETLAILHAENGILSLYDPESNTLHRAIARGAQADLPPVPIRPGEGIIGHVFATGEAYSSREIASDPRTLESTRARFLPGWGGACVPIRTTDEVIGVIIVTVPLPRELSGEEAHLLTTLAEIAGNAIQRARLHTQTEQHLQRITSLRAIDNAINSSLDLRVTLNVVLGQIVAQLGVDAAAVLLLNPHTQTLEHAASRGFRNPRLEKMSLRLGECLAGRIALERRTHFTTDLTSEDEDSARATGLANDGIITYYGTPLIAKGAVKGVMEIFHRAPLAPNAEWVDFLEALGGQVAIAIDNAELFDTLQRTNSELVIAYDATIEGWSHALDLRDRETEGHTQRVTELTVRLARAMNVSETDLVHIRRGVLLHDIGKVGIPDNILLKPGALTDKEWEVMRQHPVYARDLLASIAYLRPAIDIPYCHHEKWDGTGYPRGLRGEEIPLSARVFAVIDVWDALSSNRPYRSAWTPENVRAHVRAQSGIHFDPRVVEMFLEMQNSG